MDTTTQDSAMEVALPPLQPWKNAPTVAQLKQDLQEATPHHQAQITKINAWLDNLNVSGKAKPLTIKGRSQIQPKLIRKQAEWRYTSLSEAFLSKPNLFKVSPVTWEDQAAAVQNGLLLNQQFNTHIDKVKFIDEYVRAAVDEGTVILHTGWCFEQKEVEVKVPNVAFVSDPSFAQMHQYLEQLKTESPSQYDTDVPDELKQAHAMALQQKVPIRPVINGYKTVKQMKTVKNHPTLEVCDAHNVIIDPSCQGDIGKAGFVIHSFESDLATLKKDSRYQNLDRINITDSTILGTPDHTPSRDLQNFNFSDKTRKKFVVYQYWGKWDIDGNGTTKCIVAAWVGNIMVRLEENPYPDGELPYIVEQYLPVRKSTHGEPDGELLEDNQKVIGAVTRGMIDLMGKSANSQTGFSKSLLDATNRRKYENGQDYEFNPGQDPRQGIYQHTFPEIPASAQFMLAQQQQEAESITGVKAYSQGIGSQALGDVAAGIRGALDAASKRELGILRRLSNGLVKAGRKFIAMNAEFLSDSEVVRVTNEQFVTIRRDDLPGNFDLELTISSAEEDDGKAKELSFMLQTIGPNGDWGMTQMILSEIASLRKMPDLAHKIKTFQPQPNQFELQKQQLELQLLQEQIAKTRAEAAHYGSNAQLHTAKSATEQAKAANIASDTDQKNLDFVEQESGVKQERDLQRLGEQSRSQAQLKIVEHHLDATEAAKDRHVDLLKQYIANKNSQKQQ
jgi:hypothetical protein